MDKYNDSIQISILYDFYFNEGLDLIQNQRLTQVLVFSRDVNYFRFFLFNRKSKYLLHMTCIDSGQPVSYVEEAIGCALSASIPDKTRHPDTPFP